MDQITLDIYLKNCKKPFVTLILSKKEHLDEFMSLLNSGNKFIRFYNIIINVDNFNYATIN